MAGSGIMCYANADAGWPVGQQVGVVAGRVPPVVEGMVHGVRVVVAPKQVFPAVAGGVVVVAIRGTAEVADVLPQHKVGIALGGGLGGRGLVHHG